MSGFPCYIVERLMMPDGDTQVEITPKNFERTRRTPDLLAKEVSYNEMLDNS